MTVPIAVGSPRYAAAQIFAAELRRIMKVRKVGRRTVAKAMGMTSDSIVTQWRSGNTLPRLDSAVALADCLNHPKLVDLVKKARIGYCANPHCNRTFVNEGGKPKMFCSDACREAVQKLRVGTSTRERAVMSERRLHDAERAVHQMCRACEPEGQCHDSKCPLRPLSPLPLIVIQREVEEAVEAPGPYGTPENRAKTISALRTANARRWADPAEHEKQSELTKQMHADGRLHPIRVLHPTPYDPFRDLLNAATAVYREEINDKVGQPHQTDAPHWWDLWRAIIGARRKEKE